MQRGEHKTGATGIMHYGFQLYNTRLVEAQFVYVRARVLPAGAVTLAIQTTPRNACFLVPRKTLLARNGRCKEHREWSILDSRSLRQPHCSQRSDRARRDRARRLFPSTNHPGKNSASNLANRPIEIYAALLNGSLRLDYPSVLWLLYYSRFCIIMLEAVLRILCNVNGIEVE